MIRGSDWFSIATRIVFLTLLIGGGIYLYRRYEVVSLDLGDDSMQMIRTINERDVIEGIPRGGMVLLDLYDRAIGRDALIAYVEENADVESEIVRIGRVCGLPGDRIENTAQGFTANGIYVRNEKGFPIRMPESLAAQGFLMEGQYLILNDNPHSKNFDSRSFGAIPRERIRAKVLRNWPW